MKRAVAGLASLVYFLLLLVLVLVESPEYSLFAFWAGIADADRQQGLSMTENRKLVLVGPDGGAHSIADVRRLSKSQDFRF